MYKESLYPNINLKPIQLECVRLGSVGVNLGYLNTCVPIFIHHLSSTTWRLDFPTKRSSPQYRMGQTTMGT